ncbi:MAG: prepilin peptidase [Pseudomonadota bacterium]
MTRLPVILPRPGLAVLVPLVSGTLAAGLALTTGHGAAAALASLTLIALLAGLAWSDALSHTVPDGLSFPLIASGLLATALTGGAVGPVAVLAALLVALALLQDRFWPRRGLIGAGDYLLLAGALTWLGLNALPDLVMLSALFLGLYAICTRRAEVALAPALALATAILWFGDLHP